MANDEARMTKETQNANDDIPDGNVIIVATRLPFVRSCQLERCFACEQGLGAEFFLDAQKLVVLGDPVSAAC